MARILVDLKDVIRALNVDEETLAKMIREDKLPAYAVAGETAAPAGNGTGHGAGNGTAAAAPPAVQQPAAPHHTAPHEDGAPFDHRSDPGVFSVLDYNKDAVPMFLHDAFAVVFRTYETFTCVRREHAHNESVYRRMRQVFEDFGLDTSEFRKLAGRHRVSPGRWIRTKDAPRDFHRKVNIRVSADRLRAYLVVYPAKGTGTIRRGDIERNCGARAWARTRTAAASTTCCATACSGTCCCWPRATLRPQVATRSCSTTSTAAPRSPRACSKTGTWTSRTLRTSPSYARATP